MAGSTPAAQPGPHVGIVVLNWRNASDTVECLGSLLELRDTSFTIYVVDNASGDESLPVIAAWCDAQLPPERVHRERFASEGARLSGRGVPRGERPHVCVIQSDRNGGYSAGNNIGIRAARRDGCDHVWLLNNDTTVAPDALAVMIDVAERHAPVGMIGACLVEYFAPDTVQCLGGVRFDWRLTKKRPVSAGLPLAEVGRVCDERLAYDYTMGASIFVPSYVFEQVGLLAEDYFLYHEELDFAQRCARAGLPMRTACGARVFHKYGASAGSSADLRKKSFTSAFYGARSAVLCTRRFRPALLPIVVPVRIAYALSMAVRGAPRLVLPTLRGALAGLFAPRTPVPTL